jgi:hypothetical protein
MLNQLQSIRMPGMTWTQDQICTLACIEVPNTLASRSIAEAPGVNGGADREARAAGRSACATGGCAPGVRLDLLRAARSRSMAW